MMNKIFLFSIALLSFICCEKISTDVSAKNNNQTVTTSIEFIGDTLVLVTDSDRWYLSPTQWSGLITDSIPAVNKPYSIPTHAEAVVLHNLTCPSSHRYLCIKDTVWYTFGMPSKSVSKAGKKTVYILRPLLRVKTKEDSIIVKI